MKRDRVTTYQHEFSTCVRQLDEQVSEVIR